MLKSLKHVNILEHYGHSSGSVGGVPQLLIVTELCDYSLDYYTTGGQTGNIQGKTIPPMSESVLWAILKDVATGLTHLHSNSIVHRDLKPGNIFCKANNYKLGDFGISKKIEDEPYTATSNIGSPAYMAPELLQSDGIDTSYDTSVDIYSFGIIVNALWSKKFPYSGIFRGTPLQLLNKVHKTGLRPTIEDCPAMFSQLARRCWAGDPKSRPTATQVCQTLEELASNFQSNAAHQARSTNMSSGQVLSSMEPSMVL